MKKEGSKMVAQVVAWILGAVYCEPSADHIQGGVGKIDGEPVTCNKAIRLHVSAMSVQRFCEDSWRARRTRSWCQAAKGGGTHWCCY